MEVEMTRSFSIAWAVVAIFTLTAYAEDKKPKPTPAPAAQAGPPKPGNETRALSIFIGNWSGDGKVQAGAFQPGSPEMPSKAKQSCKWILNNMWVACDITDVAGTGKSAQTWMGHLIIGWDVEQKAYRTVGADTMGSAFELNGKMDGQKFVMESAKESLMMGTPVKFRFTWDATDPKAVKFSDERSMKGGPWQLAETITFKKSGG
jgi:hypothetical protein